MEKNTKILLGVTLGVLVLIALLQMWQISALGNILSGGSVGASQQAALPSGGMVGGC